MNKVFIIGNLTRNPETRMTNSGKTVCSFTVAVNRRGAQNGEADFFRVSAWGTLGENCHRYLLKGRKAAVVGNIRLSTYTGDDGKERSSLEVMADDVEFLSPKQEGGMAPAEPNKPTGQNSGFTPVDPGDELPF